MAVKSMPKVSRRKEVRASEELERGSHCAVGGSSCGRCTTGWLGPGARPVSRMVACSSGAGARPLLPGWCGAGAVEAVDSCRNEVKLDLLGCARPQACSLEQRPSKGCMLESCVPRSRVQG